MSTPYGSPEPGEPGEPSPEKPYGYEPYPQQPAPAWSQPGYPQQPGYQQQPGYPPQPGYGQPGYGQPGYGPGYGYAARPDHPKAVTALVLGLVGLVGGLACGVAFLVSPFAWVMGARVRREIDAQPGLGGRGQATAGMITGIIGTVLLVLGVALVVLFIVLGVTGALDDSSSSSDSSSNAGQSWQPTSTGSLTSRMA